MPATRVPPAGIIRVIDRVRDGLGRLRRQSAPPPAVLLELILGAWVSQGISVAAELKIADALAAGPLNAEELAQRVGADPDALARLMRALISAGVFTVRRGRFALNPLADALRTDAPVSIAAMARFVGSVQHREHWSRFTEAVRTGQSVIPGMRGMPAFDYLHSEPQLGALFNDAMTSMSELAIDPVVAAYDFTPFATITDVGGGHGRLLAAILQAAPDARGVLYDLAEVVEGAPELLRRFRVDDRVTVQSGSFFESVPTASALYVMKNVIHDWPDAEAVDILTTVRAAASPGTKLVLLEAVIPEHHREFLPKWLDMEMLVSAGGRERTEAEYRALYQRAGFRLDRVVPTATPFSLIEGTAI
ncbi:methyltransferase [Mycobacterium sp. NPDC003323]